MNVVFDHPDHYVTRVLAKELLGPGIAVAACDPREDRGGLWPQEQEAVRDAVMARQLEFKAGRFAARLAMEDLGIARAPIPAGPDRGPVWPKGLTGSISHCETTCVAAVARNRDVLSLGLDVEPAVGLEHDLIDIVCTDAERAWLSRQKPEIRAVLAKLIFSAKEASYKAQFPVTRQIFDFHGLSLEIDFQASRFTALFCQNVPPFAEGQRLSGGFAIAKGLIVTALVLRPGDAGLRPLPEPS